MGKLVAICISKEKGTRKEEIGEVEIIENFGLKDDAHGGNWHRQVSFLEKEQIDAFNKRGGHVSYGDFGENIVLEGVDLSNVGVGDRLKIGEAIIEITQLGKECHNRCSIFYSVGECIMPKKGIFGKVLKGGKVSVGEYVELLKRNLK